MMQFQIPQAIMRRLSSLVLLMLTILMTIFPAQGREFYVFPGGSDSNDGSLDYPFQTIDKAVDEVQAGDAIVLRGGVYVGYHTIRIDKSGTAEKPITLWAYQDEVPVLDFQNGGSSDRGINLQGSYWHLKGFIIQQAGDNGIIVYGANNLLELLVTRYNGDSGMQLHTGATQNLILACDSYMNYDPANHGENADGFAAKFGLGPGNTFMGCRSWSNSDDGYDFWEADSGVTLVNCWAFRNGENIWEDPSFSGDGNGFKLGHGYGAHVLVGCMAYDQPHHGIDVNGNQTGVTVINCTCVANRGRNFYFDEHSDLHVLRNNLSHLGEVLIYNEIDDANNSWNGFEVEDTDFRSLDPNGIDGPRAVDGGQPRLTFLRLSAASPMIDSGIDMEWPYLGEAPDLGAFEHLQGDCDGNGTVDYIDLECLTAHWLDTDCGLCNGADFDGNGMVDVYDFTHLSSNWLNHWPRSVQPVWPLSPER